MAPVVPIIDMSDFEARRDAVTAQLMEAAENIGFFQVNGVTRSTPLQKHVAPAEVPVNSSLCAGLRHAMHCSHSLMCMLCSTIGCSFSLLWLQARTWCQPNGACVQVVNHGIPLELVDGMFAASAR